MSPPTRGAARGAPTSRMSTHAPSHVHAHRYGVGTRPGYSRSTHGVLAGTPAAAATSASTRRSAPASRTARCSARSLRQVLTRCSRGAHAGCPPTRRYSADSRGISVGGVVGGVLGCLLGIAGAVILYKTWRVLEVKRRGRNRKELLMLGGGMSAREKPTAAGTDGLPLLCFFAQARPRPPRLEPPWHTSDSKSPWRSSRSVYSRVGLRFNARCVHARACDCRQAPAPMRSGYLPA
jgi:hypothetical protein